jgi:hypothetical protein
MITKHGQQEWRKRVGVHGVIHRAATSGVYELPGRVAPWRLRFVTIAWVLDGCESGHLTRSNKGCYYLTCSTSVTAWTPTLISYLYLNLHHRSPFPSPHLHRPQLRCCLCRPTPPPEPPPLTPSAHATVTPPRNPAQLKPQHGTPPDTCKMHICLF